MRILLILTLFLTFSCKLAEKGKRGARGKASHVLNGSNGSDGAKGDAGVKGDKGDKGDSGDNASSSLSSTELPDYGECIELSDGIYGENEGKHIDIYNNDQCSHSNDGTLCNNLKEGHNCWIECKQYSVKGRYDDIIVYALNFCNE